MVSALSISYFVYLISVILIVYKNMFWLI